jgi:endonuclease G
MTRREDPVWGSAEEAARGNDDSMHVTNVVPQMQAFNAPIWLGLENYALGNARDGGMRISVITGPLFCADDRTVEAVRIPRAFWKVIAFVHDVTGKLCATGYRMSQADQLPKEEFVYGAYPEIGDTVQVRLADIEREAGISFGVLARFDPKARESISRRPAPLRAFADIQFLGVEQ